MSRGTNLAHRFQYFLIPAFLLLLLDTFLATRRRRRRAVSPVSTTATVTAAAALLMLGCTRSGVPDRKATAVYNRGTALLARPDSLTEALRLLANAEMTEDPEVRFRARFNGGFVHLRRGLAARGDSARLPLDSALAVYRRALAVRPDDLDAKWNYELALRRQQSGGGGGGGGGGGETQPQPDPADSNEEAPRPRPIAGMNEQRAEQILNAIEQEEQDVQGRKQRRSVPQPPPHGRDW